MMMSDPKPDPEDEGGEGEGEENKPAGDPAPNEPEQEAAKKDQPATAAVEKKPEEDDPRRQWNRASREMRPAPKDRGYQTR